MYLLEYLAHNWKYSNAPEGQAPFEKVIGLTKFGFGASFGIGIYDCVLLTQAYQFWEVVNCMSYWMIPITAMCATFASVAYTVTKIRGQDGYVNYALASLASGGVFYKWQKRGTLSYHATVVILAGAMLKKHHDFIGETPFPIENLKIRTSNAIVPFDFSLVKDPRGPRPWEQ
ncbi:uncharacterized protein LOC109852688 [Pseudomyrmex gracilis]|uniref:uncharacterized protein LOC109852688 n=1 Tax=Pseudomyrmex gracilis TaxID=219809 RepID=UPI00099554CB|nr:uncharacterized protein LOC109852688 [Pseudomyrmex gracilis]XP_020279677.1 uncharacterized protein LOC109852688 [Pseudomyrmex gracilis]